MGELMLIKSASLNEEIEELVIRYETVSQVRDRRLFTDFLVNGYRMTTLNSVSSKDLDKVIFAKVCLGMIITLYDDLADNPQYYNPKLLKFLYLLNIGEVQEAPAMNSSDLAIYELAQYLFLNLEASIKKFSNYTSYADILNFDIQHVFLANRYSELITGNPTLRNMTESKILGPYNMGMVAAGMIDLMASPTFDELELGDIREALIRGQRLGRIGNLVSTYQREISEGDITNEILIDPTGPDSYKTALLKEFHEGLLEIKGLQKKVTSIDLNSYIDGLQALYHLHINLVGII